MKHIVAAARSLTGDETAVAVDPISVVTFFARIDAAVATRRADSANRNRHRRSGYRHRILQIPLRLLGRPSGAPRRHKRCGGSCLGIRRH